MTAPRRRKRFHRSARKWSFLAIAKAKQWSRWAWSNSPKRLNFRVDFDPLASIKAAKRRQQILAGSLVGFGLLLIWLIISSYLSFQAAVTANTTLDLEATKLLATHDKPSDQASSTKESGAAADVTPEQLRANAETAIQRDPLDASALRILGQLANASGDEAKAASFMQAAADRSPHESIALAWLIQKSYQRADYATVLHYTDALLRNQPQFAPYVAPVLARIAENKDTRGELIKLLATDPPWRARLLSALPKNMSDPRIPLSLLLSLRETPSPPTIRDFINYINFLVQYKHYDVAYYTWLQLLPPEQLSKVGFLYNGNFDTEPSGSPFDWIIKSGSGVTADIATTDDGQRGLFIQFGYGRVQFPGVSQLMLLGPGHYQFGGRYKSDLVARRGLRWRVTCAGGAVIGQSALVGGTVSTWKDFTLSFTVPPANCRAQYVQLILDSRSASEQFISGSIWYNHLEVSRVESASLKPAVAQ